MVLPAGIDMPMYAGSNPVRARLAAHSELYPVERMLAIEREAEAKICSSSPTMTPMGDTWAYEGNSGS